LSTEILSPAALGVRTLLLDHKELVRGMAPTEPSDSAVASQRRAEVYVLFKLLEGAVEVPAEDMRHPLQKSLASMSGMMASDAESKSL
jgi:hypothetical protein